MLSYWQRMARIANRNSLLRMVSVASAASGFLYLRGDSDSSEHWFPWTSSFSSLFSSLLFYRGKVDAKEQFSVLVGKLYSKYVYVHGLHCRVIGLLFLIGNHGLRLCFFFFLLLLFNVLHYQFANKPTMNLNGRNNGIDICSGTISGVTVVAMETCSRYNSSGLIPFSDTIPIWLVFFKNILVIYFDISVDGQCS